MDSQIQASRYEIRKCIKKLREVEFEASSFALTAGWAGDSSIELGWPRRPSFYWAAVRLWWEMEVGWFGRWNAVGAGKNLYM